MSVKSCQLGLAQDVPLHGVLEDGLRDLHLEYGSCFVPKNLRAQRDACIRLRFRRSNLVMDPAKFVTEKKGARKRHPY